jgi:Zn-dependent protease
MPTGSQGSIRLFRFAGINVFLHWSWFLVAVIEINSRAGRYSSILWNVVEYLALFLIVTIHEFGHALACRQVGGIAHQIVLWPLGGVAYVNPPPRPGATLWSLAAGPLVNVVLVPVLMVALGTARALNWPIDNPNAYVLVRSLAFINAALLVFNLLPIFPLDGGQILRSLLWFVMGRARSLQVATLFGFVGVAGLIFFAIRAGSLWIAVMAAFILLNCWGGLKQSVVLLKMAKLPRRHGYECPWCKSEPPLGYMWRCGNCRTMFDMFETQAKCPNCGAQYLAIQCLDCGRPTPLNEWETVVVAQPVSTEGVPHSHA